MEDQIAIEQAKAEMYWMLGSEIQPSGVPVDTGQYMQLAQIAERNVARMAKMPAIIGVPRRAW